MDEHSTAKEMNEDIDNEKDDDFDNENDDDFDNENDDNCKGLQENDDGNDEGNEYPKEWPDWLLFDFIDHVWGYSNKETKTLTTSINEDSKQQKLELE